MIFECPRCHYQTNKKSTIISHYSRKTPCETIFSGSSLESLLIDINENNPAKNIECQYCNKKFSSRCGLFYHNKTCTKDAMQERRIRELETKINFLLRERENAQ